ncbi:MAG: GTP-binding protein, partial [Thermodesulfobacteriota bacterium]
MPCIIGTAGHVDHGKTALVKALTGIDTDRLREEKRRGVSIELGFARLTLPGGLDAALVDVPGHERFIRNMLAGVTGIDMVLFCVAADDGVMPQTREHLEIVHLLGVERGVFVITKTDLVTPERVKEVAGDIRALLSPTVLKGSRVVAVSTATGEGIDELKGQLSDMVEGAEGGERSGPSAFFRLPIDRSFSIKGFGTVVTG